jgi:hypothetical protein
MICALRGADLSKLFEAVRLLMRRELRRPVEVSGWIISDEGQSEPCVVSNLSPTGAKLTVLSRDDLPAEFTVSVEGSKHRSRLIWRAGLHVGIEFLPDVPAAARPRVTLKPAPICG